MSFILNELDMRSILSTEKKMRRLLLFAFHINIDFDCDTDTVLPSFAQRRRSRKDDGKQERQKKKSLPLFHPSDVDAFKITNAIQILVLT